MKRIELKEHISWHGTTYEPGMQTVPDDLAEAIAPTPPPERQLAATNPVAAQEHEKEAVEKSKKKGSN